MLILEPNFSVFLGSPPLKTVKILILGGTGLGPWHGDGHKVSPLLFPRQRSEGATTTTSTGVTPSGQLQQHKDNRQQRNKSLGQVLLQASLEHCKEPVRSRMAVEVGVAHFFAW